MVATYKKITGAHIKWLAIITMLIDHVGAVLIEPILLAAMQDALLSSAAFYQQYEQYWYGLYMILRGIGRFAFPAFCFLLVEGFVHTKSRVRYLRNLLLFAVISEVPFDLAIGGKPFTMDFQNVFFTLALGFAAIWIGNYLLLRAMQSGEKAGVYRLLGVVVFIAFALTAEAIHADYGFVGVCVIMIFYALHYKPVAAAVVSTIILSLSSWLEIFCFPVIFAVMCYNGQRGRQTKYFFYIFYPLHLLILVAVRWVLFS